MNPLLRSLAKVRASICLFSLWLVRWLWFWYRNIPDVSLNAACESAYTFYWKGSLDTFCGTSGGTPTFAGIVADIVQAAGHRLGFLNPALYSIATSDPSVFHDVTTGCSLVKVGSNTQTGYCASQGWDFVTGWGSPDAVQLAKHLAPNATVVSEFQRPVPLITATVVMALILVSSLRRKVNA